MVKSVLGLKIIIWGIKYGKLKWQGDHFSGREAFLSRKNKFIFDDMMKLQTFFVD